MTECHVVTAMPRGCTPAFSLGLLCQWLCPVGYKAGDLEVSCHHLCPVGYQSQSSLTGTACFGALPWCVRVGLIGILPWSGQYVDFVNGHISQLLNYFIDNILPLICYLMFGLETLLPHQDTVTWLQPGAPHLPVILSFMPFGLLILYFLVQITSPMQILLQSADTIMMSLMKLFSC